MNDTQHWLNVRMKKAQLLHIIYTKPSQVCFTVLVRALIWQSGVQRGQGAIAYQPVWMYASFIWWSKPSLATWWLVIFQSCQKWNINKARHSPSKAKQGQSFPDLSKFKFKNHSCICQKTINYKIQWHKKDLMYVAWQVVSLHGPKGLKMTGFGWPRF